MNDEERILILGALLHDIGKLDYSPGKPHHVSAEDFIDCLNLSQDFKNLIKKIVRQHHDEQHPDRLAKIIIDSDHLSAKVEREKRGEDRGRRETEPLKSVFSDISISDNTPSKAYYYPLQILFFVKEIKCPITKEDAILYSRSLITGRKEVSRTLSEAYKELSKKLKNEFNALSFDDIDNSINTLNYILKKYLQFVPSATYLDIPDISLYDHLKTTTAIAICKYKAENKEKPYLLIEGDVSGIQNFIFYAQKDIEAEKGSAKRLRGRSFFINLLVDASVFYILNEFDLTEVNVLLQSGGHFIILAPNSEENKKKLNEIKAKINEYLYKKYGSILYMAISYVEGGDEDIKSYAEFRERLNIETEKVKNRKFEEMLDELFKEEDIILTENIVCVICGRNKKKEGVNRNGEKYEICETCEDLFELGDKIVDCGHILRYFGEGGDFIIEINNKKISYDFIKEGEKIKVKGDKPAIYSLNNFDIIPKSNCVQGFKLLGIHVPIIQENTIFRTKTFDEITKPIKGEEPIKLAILKADVDNLGWIFSKGIKKELRSISRISTTSFLFDLFFSLYINELAKKKKENGHGCYVVFSGGDDLIVVGRFDEIIEFARDLREFFSKWVSENPDITISAGIEVAHYKFPLKRLVGYADDALDESKSIRCEKCFGKNIEKEKPKEDIYIYKKCEHKFTRRKDKITLFDRTLSWKKFNDVLEMIEKIEENEKNVSSGILYQLFEIWQKSNEKDVTKKISVIISPDPYVKYCLVRNWKGNKDEKFYEFEREIIKNFEIMDVVVSLFSLLHRYGLKIGR